METYAAILREKIIAAANGNEKPLAGKHIVVDAGNGAGGFFAERVLAPLGADTAGSRYLDPDGRFPTMCRTPSCRRRWTASVRRCSKAMPISASFLIPTWTAQGRCSRTARSSTATQEAKEAGFTISIDDNSVISGDTAAIQAANENKDGDILFGLNETRWSQVVDGVYENLKLVDWTPTWAGEVGEYAYPGAAYGLVIQNVLMLYRTDELGTNGEKLHFQHWADVVDSGYTWYRQNKVGGTTNANINSAMLYPFTDPASSRRRHLHRGLGDAVEVLRRGQVLLRRHL